MSKSKKEEYISEEEMAELRALSSDEKLGRLKYIEDEVLKTKANIKDQKEAARDYIKEMEARRKVLMEAVDIAPIQG